MKKTFPLQVPGQAEQRVLEAIKGDVRKYIKRERRKARPTEVDFWDFACKVGADKAEPETRHHAEVIPAIDAVANAGAAAVYVEIIAIPGHRMKKATEAAPGTEGETEPLRDEPALE